MIMSLLVVVIFYREVGNLMNGLFGLVIILYGSFTSLSPEFVEF